MLAVIGLPTEANSEAEFDAEYEAEAVAEAVAVAEFEAESQAVSNVRRVASVGPPTKPVAMTVTRTASPK